MLDLFYVANLVLYGELEEDLKVMVGCFIEVCRRRGLKSNVDMMVLGGKERLICEVFVNRM